MFKELYIAESVFSRAKSNRTENSESKVNVDRTIKLSATHLVFETLTRHVGVPGTRDCIFAFTFTILHNPHTPSFLPSSNTPYLLP